MELLFILNWYNEDITLLRNFTIQKQRTKLYWAPLRLRTPLSHSLTTQSEIHKKRGHSDPHVSGPVRVSCAKRTSSDVRQRAILCVCVCIKRAMETVLHRQSPEISPRRSDPPSCGWEQTEHVQLEMSQHVRIFMWVHAHACLCVLEHHDLWWLWFCRWWMTTLAAGGFFPKVSRCIYIMRCTINSALHVCNEYT